MNLKRWRKGKKEWSKWHILRDGSESECYCGTQAPDETSGTSFEAQTDISPMGKDVCKHCHYSFYGLGPQLRRVSKGKQNHIYALDEH